MTIIDRNYQKEQDYDKVLSFLRKEYKEDPHFPGWKAQRFEDMEYRLNTMYICMGGAHGINASIFGKRTVQWSDSALVKGREKISFMLKRRMSFYILRWWNGPKLICV
ncbi:hypothetical protein LI156_21510 [Blautia producta]|uniref:hypothetical protein n=1 Tax=Blautia producta TaxID=33035 RepID=UPI001D06AD87|nr:hypothetical protein [Blautia producta]MCB6784673.1 hypothetical protein [Blautia producta]